MLYRNLEQIKDKYTTEMKNFYYNYDRISHIALIEEMKNIEEAKKFGRKYALPKDILNGESHLVTSSFVQGLQMAEFQYIINNLNDVAKTHKLFCDDKPDQEVIDNAILTLVENNVSPNYMIVPIEFFVYMYSWGMTYGENRLPPRIRHVKTTPYYLFMGLSLEIIWSNKFVNLQNIILGNKHDGLWGYIPDQNTNERITIEFEQTALPQDYLLIQTIFRYWPPQSENVSIIEFAEDVFRLESEME